MLSLRELQDLRNEVLKGKDAEKIRMVENSVSNASFDDVLFHNDVLEHRQHLFTHELEPVPEVTNQENSGRCWIFSGLNLFRRPMMVKYGLESFEFSQSYVAFYNQLERANYFVYWLQKTMKETPDFDFTVYNLPYQYWFNTVFDDGGQFAVFVHLVKKYGIVPKEEYGETFESSNTEFLISLLKNTSMDLVVKVKNMKQPITDAQWKEIRNTYMSQMYRLLVQFYGLPPTHFVFKYSTGEVKKRFKKTRKSDGEVFRVHGGAKTKKFRLKLNKNFHITNPITPVEFYEKYVPFDLDNMISLINDPRNIYNRMYIVQDLKTVVEVPEISHFNVPIEDLENITKDSIDAGIPVWFTCDVGHYIHMSKEVADLDIYDEEKDIGIPSLKNMSKKDRLIYGTSKLDHAMLICGYHIGYDAPDMDVHTDADAKRQKELCESHKNKVSRWKIENSWSGEGDGNGYLTISHPWYKEFVYQIVVDKSVLSPKLRKRVEECQNKMDKSRIKKEAGVSTDEFYVLPTYDPFGNGAMVNF
jgi:bleomycin hydrolase